MERQTNGVPKLIVYHANQCDPKKCTGIRLNRMSKAKIVKDMRRIPRGSIVLNPISEIALSPADRIPVMKSGFHIFWQPIQSTRTNLSSSQQLKL
jgi:ribosome biogenesis protein Tsr3